MLDYHKKVSRIFDLEFDLFLAEMERDDHEIERIKKEISELKKTVSTAVYSLGDLPGIVSGKRSAELSSC